MPAMRDQADVDELAAAEQRAATLQRRIESGEFAGCRVTISGLVSGETAAACLEVKESTLRKWRSRDYGPDYLKIGGRVWYSVAAIAEFLHASAHRCSRV